MAHPVRERGQIVIYLIKGVSRGHGVMCLDDGFRFSEHHLGPVQVTLIDQVLTLSARVLRIVAQCFHEMLAAFAVFVQFFIQLYNSFKTEL